MKKLFLIMLLSCFYAGSAFANVNVVATLPWIGSLAREIGGNKVEVTVLVKPNQDAHTIEAKPSMILAARKADIILYDGLDLEIGYLPLIIESSKNPKLMPGRPGNFDCSRYITVLEKPVSVDRSMGDVHPLGNPHYHYSPSRVLRVADGMAQRLAGMDEANAASYRANYRAFAKRVQAREQAWHSAGLAGRKYVAYHKYFEYLAREFGFRIVGYLEPKPGIPPSATHVEELIETMKQEKPSAILVTPAIGKDEADSLSSKTGVKVIVLPHDVGSLPGTDDLPAFWDAVVNALK